MKTILTTCLFLFISLFAFSQTPSTCPETVFVYDAAGNRVKRQFDLSGVCPSYPIPPPADSTLTVTTYPNPTCSLLNIDIASKTACSEPTMVYMYDINAQPVFVGNASNKKIQLDVSSLSQGTYIIKVVSCDYQSSAVVLKACNNSTIPNQSSVKRVTEVKY